MTTTQGEESPSTDELLSFAIERVDAIFADTTPVPQDDGPDKVCCIDYPPNFVKVYDYFRAVLQSNEISPRVFGLTALCLDQNAANYTVWHVRRQCFWALQQQQQETAQQQEQSDNDSSATATAKNRAALVNELDFTADLSGANPKNYQVWYHRRSLLEGFASSLSQYRESELAYIAAVLQVDGKNYHAWSHRQWFVLTLLRQQQQDEENGNSLYESELAYTKLLIEQDMRNNSAWNHRWFVVHNQNGQKLTAVSAPVLRSEVTFALSQVTLDPYNESSCRYLVALLKEAQQQDSQQVLIHDCLEPLQMLQAQYPDASALLSTLLDLYERVQQADRALELLDTLVEVDPIRTRYWNWRKEQIAAGTTAVS